MKSAFGIEHGEFSKGLPSALRGLKNTPSEKVFSALGGKGKMTGNGPRMTPHNQRVASQAGRVETHIRGREASRLMAQGKTARAKGEIKGGQGVKRLQGALASGTAFDPGKRFGGKTNTKIARKIGGF